VRPEIAKRQTLFSTVLLKTTCFPGSLRIAGVLRGGSFAIKNRFVR
jgi:hypothetical protein